jgi:hypothetical protein
MILVIEQPQQLDALSGPTMREHECSLQLTLRRMGFYAARPVDRRSRRLHGPASTQDARRRGPDAP